VKLLAVVLAGLLALIQYPLWLGHGSWLRVWELDRQLGLQQEVNAGKRMRNEGLEAEASDLRNGTLAIEERARYELGMVKQDEIFVQLNSSGGGAAPRLDRSPTVPGPAPGAPSSGAIDPADAPLEAPRRRAGGVVTVGR
jgi:cell division protein FtsB